MPARARDLIRALRDYGIEVRTGGKHWQAVRDSTVFPIPLHNGEKTEITDVYLRAVCRAFGLELAELRRRL